MLQQLEHYLGDGVLKLIQGAGFKREENEWREVYSPGAKIERVFLLGLGKRDKLTADKVRRFAGTVQKKMDALKVAEYASYLSAVLRGTRHRLIKHRQFTDDELRGITSPVLLVFGDSEVCVDFRAVVDRARSCIGALDVRIITGTGHALQGEKPDVVNRLIIDAIAS